MAVTYPYSFGPDLPSEGVQVPGLSSLPALGGLLGGGGSKATATSNVASTVTVGLQNILGGGAAAPQTGGTASSNPSFQESTTPPSYPGWLPSSATPGGVSAYSPSAGQNESSSLLDDPMTLVIAGIGIFAAWYFLQ